ncbi:MAG: hydroxymethylbilane synthase [Bosea sp. (in: a-proteobacteria)]
MKPVVIGTRGSPLALAQANLTAAALAATHGWDERTAQAHLATRIIKTTGDAIQTSSLAEAGGKGLFTKEIDEAQLRGEVDIAVHSAKDLPTVLPEGLVLAGYLPREDVRDALLSRHGPTLADLPQGALIGSASIRRCAMARRYRPDLRTALLRGSVGTRISRIEAGEFDATFLAIAGLNRLGLADKAAGVIPVETFLPAVGQGAIAFVARRDDATTLTQIANISCAATGHAVTAERAMLAVLDGSCRTPIAGHARMVDGVMHLKGLVISPDGSAWAEGERQGPVSDAARMGHDLGHDLKARSPNLS